MPPLAEKPNPETEQAPRSAGWQVSGLIKTRGRRSDGSPKTRLDR